LRQLGYKPDRSLKLEQYLERRRLWFETRRTLTYRNLNKTKNWEDRAAKMRALSGEMGDPRAKLLLLDLANDYDKLAARTEDRAKDPGDRTKSHRQIAERSAPSACRAH
jgi:hypothetical protein